MRVAIDVSQIVYGTGVAIYTRNLVENLLKIDGEDKFVPFAGALRRRSDVLDVFPGARVFPIPPTLADLIWNRFHIFPVDKLIGETDVVHTSDWTEPPSKAAKVTTVHDLYPLKFPKMIDPKILNVHKRKLSWVMRESKRIIAPSESTKNDLTDFGFRPEIIRVIPEAPSLSKATGIEVNDIKKKYQIRDDYLISIGATQLKNTKRIIEAFHLSSAGKEVKLAVVGRPTGVKIEPERNIRMLGYVPQNDLKALLTGSRGLIFASLYEGYGIPILDAFACEVPVITSNTASMPEVAGGAAIIVDPYDTSSIADAIAKVIRGAKEYVEKGKVRVKEFSWEKTARMTLDVYREALK